MDWISIPDTQDEYRQCEETITLYIRCIYPLAAVEHLRRYFTEPHSLYSRPDISGGYGIECDAIYDIEIVDPENKLTRVGMDFSEIDLKSKKEENGKWDIEKWFTQEKPSLIFMAPFTVVNLYLGIDRDARLETITIRWKQMKVGREKHLDLLPQTLMIDYGGILGIRYQNGIAFAQRYDCRYLLLRKEDFT